MPPASWLIIRNVATEGPGLLGRALSEAGAAYRTVDAFGSDPLPLDPDGLAGLVVLGGPMGVYEATRYPALITQQHLIAAAVAADLPVLGICLGAQLLASAFGASVFPGPDKEIGWSPLELTDAGAADPVLAPLARAPAVFHLHGDTFDIPANATHLARSRLFPMQAFRIGPRAYGLQFHLEFTVETIDTVLQDPACRADLAALGCSTAAIRSATPARVRALEPIAQEVFGNFLRLG
jgi:GMP synthase-like glutamine amidotransferase